MNNLICVSTGVVYKITEDMNKKIELLKEFSLDGMELCFADAQYLIDFQITEENIRYLHSLKFVSIHAPWLGVRYENNEKSCDVLLAIENIYHVINAKNVVFHADFIDDFSVFKNCNFVFSIENNDWKYPFNTIPEIELLLKNNEKLKFTFDFAHVLTLSAKDISIYIEKFKNKIIQVHLSYLDRQLPEHWFLHKFNNAETRNLTSHLRILEVPIVLECVATNRSELALIEEEIKYVKNIFTGFPLPRE